MVSICSIGLLLLDKFRIVDWREIEEKLVNFRAQELSRKKIKKWLREMDHARTYLMEN